MRVPLEFSRTERNLREFVPVSAGMFLESLAMLACGVLVP